MAVRRLLYSSFLLCGLLGAGCNSEPAAEPAAEAAAEPAAEAAAEPAAESDLEVFNTASDEDEPWLNLRAGPSGLTPKLAALKDGTKLQKLSDVDENSWIEVKVASGDNAGKTGFVSARYVQGPDGPLRPDTSGEDALRTFLHSVEGTYGWETTVDQFSYDFFQDGRLHIQGPDGEATMWQGKWSLSGDQLTLENTDEGTTKTVTAVIDGDSLKLGDATYTRHTP